MADQAVPGSDPPLTSGGTPSVDSDVKEQRMAARRQRVKEKLEAARLEAMGGQAEEKEQEEVKDPERERQSRCIHWVFVGLFGCNWPVYGASVHFVLYAQSKRHKIAQTHEVYIYPVYNFQHW